MSLGQFISIRRKRMLMTQEELAKKTNVSKSAIAKWETDGGIPDRDNLYKLANILGVTVNDMHQIIRSMKYKDIDLTVNITPRFSLHKIKGDLTTYPLEENSYDVIYFDAFAPEKQPEMWSAELLGRIARSLREEGILSTYCAKGEVRRRLQQAGLTVHRTPGPPGGKREILQAIRIPSQNR